MTGKQEIKGNPGDEGATPPKGQGNKKSAPDYRIGSIKDLEKRYNDLVSKLQTEVDLQNDSYVEIDSRFDKPIFGGFANMRRWCQNWGIAFETFIRPGEFRSDRKTPIEWVSFKYQAPEQVVII